MTLFHQIFLHVEFPTKILPVYVLYAPTAHYPDLRIVIMCFIGKAIPLQAWTGPEGSRSLRLPDFKVVSPTHRPPLPPGSIPGTHFCYRLSQPQYYVNKKFQ